MSKGQEGWPEASICLAPCPCGSSLSLQRPYAAMSTWRDTPCSRRRPQPGRSGGERPRDPAVPPQPGLPRQRPARAREPAWHRRARRERQRARVLLAAFRATECLQQHHAASQRWADSRAWRCHETSWHGWQCQYCNATIGIAFEQQWPPDLADPDHDYTGNHVLGTNNGQEIERAEAIPRTVPMAATPVPGRIVPGVDRGATSAAAASADLQLSKRARIATADLSTSSATGLPANSATPCEAQGSPTRQQIQEIAGSPCSSSGTSLDFRAPLLSLSPSKTLQRIAKPMLAPVKTGKGIEEPPGTGQGGHRGPGSSQPRLSEQ